MGVHYHLDRHNENYWFMFIKQMPSKFNLKQFKATSVQSTGIRNSLSHRCNLKKKNNRRKKKSNDEKSCRSKWPKIIFEYKINVTFVALAETTHCEIRCTPFDYY